jgi:hypothetical protein
MLRAIAIAGFAFLSFCTGAQALTCSQQRHFCIAGERSRGYRGPSMCEQAFRVCVQTGIWDARSGGPYGRRMEGMIRR